MKKLLKALAVLLAVVVVAVGGLFAVAWWQTERQLDTVYVVADPPLPVTSGPEAIARGSHLYNAVLGCGECHGSQGVGRVAIDAGPVARLVAPNLTPGALPTTYTDDALAAAVRHGVRPDGRPLRFMPVADWQHLSDADTAALVAYLRSLPASTNDPGESEIKPLGRVLAMLGQFHLVPAATIDHSPRARSAPAAGPTAEYGAYLAQACTGCHGQDFAGQHVPGTPPEFPDAANLTPHDQGLGPWQLADFQRALREGRRPDGRMLDGFMPWKAYAAMTDDEITALWAYFRTVPAKAPPAKG